jgi:hypothetical protein
MEAMPLGELKQPTYYDDFPLYEQVKVPDLRRPSRDELLKHGSMLSGQSNFNVSEAPLLELTARHSQADAGRMNVLLPLFTSDDILMNPCQQAREGYTPFPGTVVYVYFQAPKDGLYFATVNFGGYQATMEIRWGLDRRTAYCDETRGMYVPVCALWSGKAGDWWNFTLNCTAPMWAWLEGVRIYQATT